MKAWTDFKRTLIDIHRNGEHRIVPPIIQIRLSGI